MRAILSSTRLGQLLNEVNKMMPQIINFAEVNSCAYQQKCPGCQFLGKDLKLQKEYKTKKLSAVLQELNITKNIEFISPGSFSLRNRMDFVFEEGRFGLFDPVEKRILDLDTCGQLSTELLGFYKEFRKIKWPIKKGSFRLRAGPQKNFGAWLDFANQDIKLLLDKKTELQELMKISFVEIGQKAKSLIEQNGQFKLTEPKLNPWFATKHKGEVLNLQSYVSSFTQPSIKANLVLADVLEDYFKGKYFESAVEFGSGIGNLSFIFLNYVQRLIAVEFEARSLQAFRENLKNAQLDQRVEIQEGNFQNIQDFDFRNAELLILNPPRSGLGKFLLPLQYEKNRPEQIFLMSCFLESWHKDASFLKEHSYNLERLVIFDQFPQTQHFEILSFWKL